MELKKECKDCKKHINITNRSGYCSTCKERPLWKGKFEALKNDTDRRFKLYDIFIKDLTKRLSKYEPVDEEEIY